MRPGPLIARLATPAARRLLARFRPHAGRLGLAAALVVVASGLQGVPILLIRWTLDDVLIARDPARLAWLAPGVVGLYALNGAVNVWRAVLTRSVAWRVVTELREELHAHLLTLDLAWHQRTPTGERTSRLVGDVNALQYAVSGVVTAVQKPITLLVLGGTALVMNPPLALVAFVLLPFAAVPIDRFGRWVREASREALDAGARLSSHAQETFAGIRVVQAFGVEADRAAAFGALDRAHERAQVRALTASLLPAPVTELLASFGVGAVIWVGGRQVVAGTLEPGALVAFLVALAVMNQPLKGLSEVNALFQRSLAAAETVFGLLDTRPAVVGGPRREVPPPQRIRLDGVGLDYGDGPVLHDVTLEVRAGERVALVGPSGGGKTSLLQLLARLRDPTAGAVRWDGVDVRGVDLAALRGQIAVVGQETFLFDDTIAANLRVGRRDATDAEVEAAARAANAHEFIAALPRGYQTRIDELGMRLSGGQRQRLAIARAVLRDAPVLLLDEATSNLDAASEAAVQEALDRLARGRTTVVVAHRLSTVRDADRIVVLVDGRVVEEGTHATLLGQGGEYARLVARQAGEP